MYRLTCEPVHPAQDSMYVFDMRPTRSLSVHFPACTVNMTLNLNLKPEPGLNPKSEPEDEPELEHGRTPGRTPEAKPEPKYWRHTVNINTLPFLNMNPEHEH